LTESVWSQEYYGYALTVAETSPGEARRETMTFSENAIF
jgi:hypothetical protein